MTSSERVIHNEIRASAANATQLLSVDKYINGALSVYFGIFADSPFSIVLYGYIVIYWNRSLTNSI